MLNQVQELIEKCLLEASAASDDKYDTDKAERTAAMFLQAEMRLALFISDAELRAKHAKNEVERIEAEQYFEIKTASAGKTTEGFMDKSVAKADLVVQAKREQAEAEAEVRKWNYLLGVLKDGHIFFRNVGRNKLL